MGRPRQQVDVFGMQDRRKQGKAKPWIVRWRVEGQQRTKAFRTRAEADRYRADLLAGRRPAASASTSAPASRSSWQPDARVDITVLRLGPQWLADQWPEWQPRTRRSAVEALCPLRRRSSSRRTPRAAGTARVAPHGAAARRRLGDAATAARLARPALARACAISTSTSSPASTPSSAWASTAQPLGPGPPPVAQGRARLHPSRRRARRARADPWPPAPRGPQPAEGVRSRKAVDVHALPDPATMERDPRRHPVAPAGVARYQLMTAVVYYAGLRPSEVAMLRRRSTRPPRPTGWGRIDVREADIAFDEPGEPKTGPRSVPIPPVLVDAAPGVARRARLGRRRPPLPHPHRTPSRRVELEPGLAPSPRPTRPLHAGASTTAATPPPRPGSRAAPPRRGRPPPRPQRRDPRSTYVGALTGDEQLTNERISAGPQPSPETLRVA